MTLSVAEVLEKAADLIEPEGAWYPSKDGPGCYCAATAIDQAASGSLGDDLNFDADVRRFFGSLLPDNGMMDECGRIWEWNDAPDRTQCEVVAKLREAAAIARSQP